MRWKLLIAASLLAALAGAGAVLVFVNFVLGPAPEVATRENTAQIGWFIAILILFPLAATTFASIFVYRHTARRRTLQAAATALLSITLTLAALLFLPRLHAPRSTPPTDVRPAKNVG